MKRYVKDAVRELLNSDKRTVTITLKKPHDYKKNPFSLAYNHALFFFGRWMVPSHFKNALMRTTGMNIGYDACLPHYHKHDPYFPELITFGKGCIIGGGTRTVTHIVKDDRLTLGKVEVGERVLNGGMTNLLPGAYVPAGSITAMGTDLDHEIPIGEIWGGRPARLMKKITPEEHDKYFKPSEHAQGYYKEARKKINEFVKDPSQTFFKLHYNGKRLNAGNDWWRARNVFRIWYNGIIVEFSRLLPSSAFKRMLLRMTGAKIGKRVKIARGVVFDHIFPDTITVEDDVILDRNVYLGGHEYTITQTLFGKVHIHKGAHLKHDTLVRIGSVVGEGAIVEADSLVAREVPAHEHWGGNPAQQIQRS